MSRATRTETNTRSNSSGGNGVAVGHARTETMNTQDSYWFSSDTTAGSAVHSREGSGVTVRSAAEEGAAYCTTCDRMFTNQDALQTHMRASGYHPWYCEQCHVDLVRETDYVVRAERRPSTVLESYFWLFSRPIKSVFTLYVEDVRLRLQHQSRLGAMLLENRKVAQRTTGDNH